MAHKKMNRVLVYLAILGAVGTGATYAKYVSSVGSDTDAAVVAGFNVTARLETSGTSNMTENVPEEVPDINKSRFEFEIKSGVTSQQMKVTFTNNSQVWVKPIVSGGAAAKTSNWSPNFSTEVIKQGETKVYTFDISSTYNLADKTLIFTAQQVMN